MDEQIRVFLRSFLTAIKIESRGFGRITLHITQEDLSELANQAAELLGPDDAFYDSLLDPDMIEEQNKAMRALDEMSQDE